MMRKLMKTIRVITMKKNKLGLNKALENDGNFLSFLGEAARSDEYRRLKEKQAKARKFHPAREMLYDYVLGWLNETDTVKIQKHISFCGECADEVLRITRIEDDLEKESVKWVSEDPEPGEEPSVVETTPEPSVSISDIPKKFIIWASKLWEPKWAGQLVTASDIPEQEKTFISDEGQIILRCHWKAAYKNTPAYLWVSWKADISADGDLWLRFVNPETEEIYYEFSLGTDLRGEETFESDKLGFDPSNQKWAIYVLLCESEK
jgi:hypothetical protein